MSSEPVLRDELTDNVNSSVEAEKCEVNPSSKECDSAVTEESQEKKQGVEEILSEEVKEQLHTESLKLKDDGNKKFKEAAYEDAVTIYTEAIQTCPQGFPKTLSILYSNRAACYAKLDEKDMAIKGCGEALERNEYYTKARLRRAQLYESTDKLEDALKDYNEILKYDKSCQQAGEAAMRLPGQINERNEKLKEEMFGKLKELGNMCLKPFGFSTDNFKVQQDPNSGGYSVNFQK